MGLPGTPSSPIFPCSHPSSQPRPETRRLWKHLRVYWFLHPQAIGWEPSLSFSSGFQTSPLEQPGEKGGSESLNGPAQKEG